MIDFSEELKQYVIDNFEHFGIEYDSVNTREDLINLYTLFEKIIHLRPREVVYSNELKAQLTADPKWVPMVDHLKRLFMAGEDVNPHQSKQVLNHHTPDDLVFDWKIYHLHLSDKNATDGYFVDRTDELLFAYIEWERVIFLGIFTHTPAANFSRIQLLEILDNTATNILQQANGVIGLSHELNDEERLRLRKRNVNEGIVQVNRKFVFPPSQGKVSSGKSLASVRQAMNLLRWVTLNVNNINEDVPGASAYFKTRFGIEKDILYGLEFTHRGPAIMDRNSGQSLIVWQEIYTGAK